MEAFDSDFRNRSVYPLDMSIGPWMLGPGKMMFNATFSTNPITGAVCELDTVIRQHRMYAVRHSLNQIAQELRGCHLTGSGMQFGKCKLGSAINGNEEIKLTLCCLHLSNFDMEVTDGVALEALLDRTITLHLRQP